MVFLFLLMAEAFVLPAKAQSWQVLDSICKKNIVSENFDTALIYATKALKQAEKEFGKKDTNYAKACSNVGLVFDYIGQYQKAEPLFIKAADIFKATLGEMSQNYTDRLTDLAILYHEMGEYDKAESLYIQILDIDSIVIGKNHQKYGLDLNNLGELYRVMGQYNKALHICIQATDILKKTLGDKSTDYAISLNNLALIYINLGQYDNAESMLFQVMNVDTITYGKVNSHYAKSLNNLGYIYQCKFQYDKAEQMYIQALNIDKEVLGEMHPVYAVDLTNLACICQNKGNYGQAEALFIQALNIDKVALGEDHADYATDLNNLAALYRLLGQYDKAEALYIQSMQIRKKLFGDKSPGFAQSINNLAVLYVNIGLYEKALPLYLQAMNLRKQTYGEKHPAYAKSLNNLAYLYYRTQQKEKAIPLLEKALEIFKETLTERHPDYVTSLGTLAIIYTELGQFGKAEQIFLHAIKLRKEILGEDHPDYTQTLCNLAVLYERMSIPYKAEPLFLQAISNITKQITKEFDFMTEPEKFAFYKTISRNFESYLSFFLKYSHAKPLVKCCPYDVQLTQKGIILRSTYEIRRAIISSGDTDLISKYESWSEMKQQLSYLQAQSFQKQRKDSAYIKKTEENAEIIEKELVIKSKVYRESKANDTINWMSVQNNIETNEAAIEFASFSYYNNGKATDSILYCALVLRPGYSQPKMKLLFEQKQLDSLINQVGGTDHEIVNRLYFKQYSNNLKPGNSLYDLIWKPIDSLLQGVKTIYYSPSGLLHKFSFAAIKNPDGTCLSDKYNLVQLGSTGKIIQVKEHQDYIMVSDSALVFGGINYNQMDNTLDTLNENLLSSSRGMTLPVDSSRSIPWGYLKSTFYEANYIDSLFKVNKISTNYLSGSKATETSFKQKSGMAPQIIHISTHGFFFPEPEKKKTDDSFTGFSQQVYKFSENPLLRSGLILAGGNYVWTRGATTFGKDDGILTAYEVSDLDFTNTKLVVLSACQTGLGDIKGNEGVFGLQRAFKMAGVDNIIMSLWQVPGKETTEYMQQFYSNCFKKQTIREAFTNAQNWMKKKYSDDPYKWAAFVLME